MKCYQCGKEMTSGDEPNSFVCRSCKAKQFEGLRGTSHTWSNIRVWVNPENFLRCPHCSKTIGDQEATQVAERCDDLARQGFPFATDEDLDRFI